MRYRFGLLAIPGLVALAVSAASAGEWIHWRGPTQNGTAPDVGLPSEWDPRTPGENNLVWKAPYGCRSTPLIMKGKVYFINSFGDTPRVATQKEKLTMGERVVCLDEATGKLVWEKKFNVFHTDIVMNRLGWANLTADVENDRIYAHGTQGFLLCLDGKTGDTVWERSLTEEYGRVSGYGGRLVSPTFADGIVMVGMANAAWGDTAAGANRFYAFDAATGKVVWITSVPLRVKGTYYSNPIVAKINGEDLFITGGAEGSVHAMQVRTGKLVWSYNYAVGVINSSPVINGNLVYIAHGEENPEGGDIGRVICLDASQVKGGKPKLVWEYRRGIRFGLASPAFADGKLYVPDDSAKIYCFDGKKGKLLWKFNYGTLSRGAPLIADGKMYISEVNARFNIIKLNGDEAPTDEDVFQVKFRAPQGQSGFVEMNSTPAVADGRVFFATRDEMFCIGSKEAKGSAEPAAPEKKAAAPKAPTDTKVAQILLYPEELTTYPGEKIRLALNAYNAKGEFLPDAKLEGVKWSLPAPPAPKGPPGTPAPKTPPASPPPLRGELNAETGEVVIDPKVPSQQGYVLAEVDGIKAESRIRVAPKIAYAQDFEKVPVGATPGGWVNTTTKFRVVEIDDGGKKNKVLFKVNNVPAPPIARANAYVTPPIGNYTIQADMKGVEVGGALPDMGLVNSRYTVIMDGKTNAAGKRELRLVSWEALPRVTEGVEYEWKSNVWYTVKFTVTPGKDSALVQAKVWERGQAEPEKWTLEFKDPMPNSVGSPALYGYVSNVSEPEAGKIEPGSEIYFDKMTITPNPK